MSSTSKQQSEDNSDSQNSESKKLITGSKSDKSSNFWKKMFVVILVIFVLFSFVVSVYLLSVPKKTMAEHYTFRLIPGDDLYDKIQEFVNKHDVKAGVVLSSVGSLTHVTIRLSDRSNYTQYDGHFEIVSLTGTVSSYGSHLHMSFSDPDGVTLGGHLVPGCTIFTTAEMAIAAYPNVVYKREFDPKSGYNELVIKPKYGIWWK
ncbi:hypothetical protein M0813_07150 [Anaeramoeba flamelloides]|uniref:PPC domain-containing protein n=1 Tax=Anaeramoeba flamelloides TaxID=1746091 RepID=A0AAV7YDG1_9EUKA|nr:hypothetical protein M0812_26162 [Anaeramoeba flamelloides]KAJ6229929.1 hypothetical protein M0813_07150 [Anaeramoeba flamelloides]